MHYRSPDANLPEIPLIDVDEGGAERLFDLTAAGARRLAAIARRSVPALAAVALGGWAFRKWRNRRDRRADA